MGIKRLRTSDLKQGTWNPKNRQISFRNEIDLQRKKYKYPISERVLNLGVHERVLGGPWIGFPLGIPHILFFEKNWIAFWWHLNVLFHICYLELFLFCFSTFIQKFLNIDLLEIICDKIKHKVSRWPFLRFLDNFRIWLVNLKKETLQEVPQSRK